jgi:hypothetical protein
LFPTSGEARTQSLLETIEAGKVRALGKGLNFSLAAELAVFDAKGSFEVGHVGVLETSTTSRIYFRGELDRFHEFGERTMGRLDFLHEFFSEFFKKLVCRFPK